MPLEVEGLESRALLTAWVEQGPAPIVEAQNPTNSERTNTSVLPAPVPGVGSNPVVGAIESVATDPSNANIIYVGTVNGGIWKTTNGTNPNPTWTPLTDHLPSLAIADIEFSPLDPTHQTLYAATGQYTSGGLGPTGAVLSSFSRNLQGSAAGAGIYKTTDGGATWIQLGAADFEGLRLRDVVPTSLTVNGGQVVLTDVRDPGPSSGVWRSTDGGASWTRISGTDGLPTGGVSEMIADPGNPSRFYAAIPALAPLNATTKPPNSANPGIYRSDDGGLTWQPVNSGLVLPETVRIEMTIGKDLAGDNVIYAVAFTPVVRTINGEPTPGFDATAAYRAIDLPQNQIQNFQWALIRARLQIQSFEPGQQGNIHFAMVADPNVPDVFYIGGDRQPGFQQGEPPSDVGAPLPSGRNYRIPLVSETPPIAVPQPIDWFGLNGTGAGDTGANGTSPHPDSRHMVFDANGNILQVNDGGIYRLSNPDSPSRSWSSVNGNLRDTEVYSVAYDDLNHTIVAGAQDNGSAQQTSPGGQVWTEVLGGDGGVTATDNTSTHGVSSFHYIEQAGVNPTIEYQEYDSSGHLLGTHQLALMVTNEGNQPLGKVADLQFIQSYKLDHVDPTRFMIGTGAESMGPGGQFTFTGGHVFDSTDGSRGDHLTFVPDNVGTNYMVTGYDYGGRFQGVANPDIAYVGFQTGSTTGGMMLRTTAGGTFMTLPGYTAAGGTVPRAVVMDPQDDQRAFSIDENGKIYETLDGGSTWADITGNVGSLTNTLNLQTIDVLSPTGALANDVVMVGGQGGVFAVRHPGLAGSAPIWSPLGTGLSNAIVTDLHYDLKDNVAVIGTYGRGAWTLADPNSSLAPDVLALQRFGVHAQPTTLVLSFDAPLDPARAQDVTNYRLAPVGVRGRVGHAIRLRAAVYDPATQTATLLPARRLPLRQAYQLTVNGMAPRGLATTAGALLAGAGNGVSGTNFVRVINQSTLAGSAPTNDSHSRRAIKTGSSGVRVAGRSTLARQAPVNLSRSQRAIKTGSSGGVSASAVDALATSGKLTAGRPGLGHRAGRSAGLV